MISIRNLSSLFWKSNNFKRWRDRILTHGDRKVTPHIVSTAGGFYVREKITSGVLHLAWVSCLTNTIEKTGAHLRTPAFYIFF